MAMQTPQENAHMELEQARAKLVRAEALLREILQTDLYDQVKKVIIEVQNARLQVVDVMRDLEKGQL